MACVTTVVLCAVAWHAFGPTPPPPPPSVGMSAPALRLRDRSTNEPQFWMAPRGRITWLSFVRLNHKQGAADLATLDRCWRKFQARESFSALAIVCDDGAIPEALELPIALASEVTRQTFMRSGQEVQMLHYLIDQEGKIVAIARGTGATLDRLITLTEERLKFLEPVDRTRFAAEIGEDPRSIGGNSAQLPSQISIASS